MKHKTNNLIIQFLFLGTVFGFIAVVETLFAFSHPNNSLVQVSYIEGVRIEAQYLPKESQKGDKISFRLHISTHREGLKSYDIKSISSLAVNNRPPQYATAWKTDGDTHHNQGILSFHLPISENFQILTLKITNLQSSNVHVFRWDTPYLLTVKED